MKPKIAFITLSFKGGGAEKIFYTLVSNLCTEYEIILITFYKEGRYYENMHSLPVKYYSLDGERGNTINFIFRLKKILRNEKPLKILSFLYYPTIITYLSVLGTRIIQIPSERSFYGKYLNNSLKHRIYKVLLKKCYHRAPVISVLSEEMKKSMAKDFSLPLEKLSVIYNGLNFQRIDQLRGAADPAFSTEENVPVIIAVGRLNIQKNYPLLLRAFSVFLNKYKEGTLFIFGEGELEPELKRMTLNLGINENVIFAGYQNNPFPSLASASCYVLSSDWEGFPNALAEAMYVNGHVISTDCPTGPSEIIDHMQDGILCPMNNPKALAEAMGKMCFDQEFRDKVFKNSRSKVLRFEESEMIKSYKRLLDEHA